MAAMAIPKCCGEPMRLRPALDQAVCLKCGTSISGHEMLDRALEKYARVIRDTEPLDTALEGESNHIRQGVQIFEQALATTIEPPPRETSGYPVIRAESFRYDPDDGDVMVKISPSFAMPLGLEVAIDDPLALLAVTMAAIKFGHGPEMLVAARKLVTAFDKEPTP